jgi:hypothetical protein
VTVNQSVGKAFLETGIVGHIQVVFQCFVVTFNSHPVGRLHELAVADTDVRIGNGSGGGVFHRSHVSLKPLKRIGIVFLTESRITQTIVRLCILLGSGGARHGDESAIQVVCLLVVTFAIIRFGFPIVATGCYQVVVP